MATQFVGASNVVADNDQGRSLFHRRGVVSYVSGSSFVVTGGPNNPVAASLASGTTLMAMRHGATASTTLYVTKLGMTLNPAITGSSGGSPGQLVWQRFSAATPSGGTARAAARKNTSVGTPTQLADVRDHSASLSMVGVTLGEYLLFHPVPNFTIGEPKQHQTTFDEDEVVRLAPGEGLCLTANVAGPATMTWTYTYTIHYNER